MHYYKALEHGDVIKYSVLVTLTVILAVMFIVFFRHLISSKQKIRNEPIYFEFSAKILKYFSFSSILFGTLGTTILSQRILIKLGMAGHTSFVAAAGPLADALTPLIFGLLNASVGFAFYYFARRRNIRATQSIEES